MAFYSSISTLLGAMHVNRGLAARGAAQDPGGKIAALISAMNIVNANLSTIQAGLTTNGGSSFSGATWTSTYVSISNFTG